MKRIIALLLILMLMLTSCDTAIGGLIDSEFLEGILGADVTDIFPDDDDSEDNKPEDNKPDDNKTEDNDPEDNKPEDNTPEPEHRYSANVILPTCEEGGYTAHTCLDCGDTYITDETEPLGHSYESYVNPPDCDTDGYTSYTCTVCGDSYTDNETEALGHSYNSIVFDPTCEEGGYTTFVCLTCGHFYMGEKKDALGHSYESDITEPDCENGGYTTYTCHCGESYVADKTEALGHSYESVVTPPTYEDNGYTTHTCTACGHSYVDSIIGSLSHRYESTVTAPTCETDGYTTYTCTDCGDSYVTDTVPMLGHSYDDGIVITAPTCTKAGVMLYTCENDSTHTYTENISALDHSYNSTVTAPTCTDDGYTTYNCTKCDVYYVAERVDAIGHAYDDGAISIAPTCTKAGVKIYTCKHDNAHTYTVEIKATGHSYTPKKTEPTCVSSGYTTYTCYLCGYYYVSDMTSALGHKWKDATTESPKTCTVCLITEGDKLPLPDTVEILYVNYIDVGQGDSILIKMGDCDILIDAGVANKGSTVSSYLKKQGVDDVELMINTHPDADHCGGLTQVLKDFAVEAVWASPLTKTTAAFKNFDSAVKSEGLTRINPAVGTVYTYESLTLTVLYNGAGTSDSNDSSIVVMLEYGSYRFLFTGDISSTIENKLVKDKSIDLSCDVLKVAHHGSKYSSSSAFLKATGAKYGVICVGAGNSYGHPTSVALNNLSSAGISVYRTDKHGSVVFSTDGDSLTLPGNDGTLTRSLDTFMTNAYYISVNRITVSESPELQGSKRKNAY